MFLWFFLSERNVATIGISMKQNFCNEDQFLASGSLLLIDPVSCISWNISPGPFVLLKSIEICFEDNANTIRWYKNISHSSSRFGAINRFPDWYIILLRPTGDMVLLGPNFGLQMITSIRLIFYPVALIFCYEIKNLMPLLEENERLWIKN